MVNGNIKLKGIAFISKERRHSYGGMEDIIGSKLSKREQESPIVLFIAHIYQ